jgi:hypothetical protein
MFRPLQANTRSFETSVYISPGRLSLLQKRVPGNFLGVKALPARKTNSLTAV